MAAVFDRTTRLVTPQDGTYAGDTYLPYVTQPLSIVVERYQREPKTHAWFRICLVAATGYPMSERGGHYDWTLAHMFPSVRYANYDKAVEAAFALANSYGGLPVLDLSKWREQLGLALGGSA